MITSSVIAAKFFFHYFILFLFFQLMFFFVSACLGLFQYGDLHFGQIIGSSSTYYGTEHPISVGALYTLGENNPVIEGAIFTEGGLYRMDVEVISAGNVRSNLLEPLEFDLYVTIAQEQMFFITVPDNLIQMQTDHS